MDTNVFDEEVGADSEANYGFELPPIEDGLQLLSSEPNIPDEVIKGVLHKGCKGVLGGSSKSFKTWSLLDLGLSVASGTKWWGVETTQGKVLYVNFEIPSPFFQ